MLCYTSEVLQTDLSVAGPVTAVLHACSSALDTDWVVRLCDVWPDGRSLSVCDGILRARYRDSLSQPMLLEPNEVHQFQVDLWSTAQVFKAGHRLRVHVHDQLRPAFEQIEQAGPSGGPIELGVCLCAASASRLMVSSRRSHWLASSAIARVA